VSHVAALPPLLEASIALLVVLGALLAALGSWGLLRLKTFDERIHPPTMGTTLGVGFTLIASMLMFSALESRPVLHEVVIAVFAVITTPVTFMLLVRAARYRDGETGTATGDGANRESRPAQGGRSKK
jgi:multicomponent K+:H+ antiporter subunit G